MPDLMLSSYSPADIQKQKATICPMSDAQKRNLYLALEKHPEYTLSGDTMDVSALTQFDVINIRNCYGDNPFAEQPISAEKQQYLAQRLAECGLTANRDIRYILPSEYTKALDYMDGLSRTMPEILKASLGVDAMTIDKLQSFMDAKCIHSSIPLSAMSKADYAKMYGYVISQGMVPDCATPKTIDRTEEFVQSIQVDGITEKKQLLLLQLRNQIDDLQSLGIDPVNMEPILTTISEFRQSYEALAKERGRLAGEYKSLVQLKQQISYAESPSFVFGSLFNEKVHEAPEVGEKHVKAEKEINISKPPQKSSIDIDPDL